MHELFFSQLHESSHIRTCRIGAPVRSSGCRTLVVAVRTARPELLHVQDQSNLDARNFSILQPLPSSLKMHERSQGGESSLRCIEAVFAINRSSTAVLKSLSLKPLPFEGWSQLFDLLQPHTTSYTSGDLSIVYFSASFRVSFSDVSTAIVSTRPTLLSVCNTPRYYPHTTQECYHCSTLFQNVITVQCVFQK